ncbi:MAG: YihY/virulence factor BrkB family protein, partial [Actinomycetota bacterium]|nr:YihY/virulence factor BrkB family protein [Actinomycetota bacterium]
MDTGTEPRGHVGEPATPHATPGARQRRGPIRLLSRTLWKAWDDGILGQSAQAAFWQALSLPPLLLGLLG